MRAAVQHGYGPPDVVRVADVDVPEPDDGELLVRVHATTVNRTDCGYRGATPWFARLAFGLTRPRAATLGSEFAGEVVAVGRDVATFVVGDAVFGYLEPKLGGHAEYVAVPADGMVATMPAGTTFAQMAPATEGAHYALTMIRRAEVAPGDDVFVYGATGAIGSAAVQLLKAGGAVVTAACATDHVALVDRLGADRVIDYTTEDVTADERAYDVVIDAVGKQSFGRCRRMLKHDGIYVSSELGPLSLNPVLALASPVFGRRRVQFPLPMGDQAMIRELGDMVASGQFTPVVDRRYPLDDIVAAYEYVETGQKVGNVVVTVTDRTDEPV
jgi:NADPH:quinone reductase-like Zn-dependent oxidoreductase